MQLCHSVTCHFGRLACPPATLIAKDQTRPERAVGDGVRYDTMIATALAFSADDPAARAAQWRQLVDLLVQSRGAVSADVRADAYARIAVLRESVPEAQRQRAAHALAGRDDDGTSAALFALDSPAVAAPVLARARLADSDWLALIPHLPRASRALLRNRRDLPAIVVRALESYGPADLALPPGAAAVARDDGNQIRELVARIEAFRQSRADGEATDDMPAVAESFAFETDIDGVVDWIAGAPREALIGLDIAEIAEPGGCGVDGQAAGAFRRRAPFRDARLLVAGQGAAGGDWRIAASPVFNPHTGRFAGYHGTARRPRPDEVAAIAPPLSGTILPVDSLRQLIHEIRTPLNAILGFGEMINKQVLGPAAAPYRTRAHAILRDGQRLVDLVDDLDQVARAGRTPDGAGTPDVRAVIDRVAGRFNDAHDDRGVALAVVGDRGIDVTGPGTAALERAVTRLAGALLAAGRAGETLTIAVAAGSDRAEISVTRPRALAGLSDAALLDAAPGPDDADRDVPLLGLGFTLRLIDSVARGHGGGFAIHDDRFVITLPRERARDSGVR